MLKDDRMMSMLTFVVIMLVVGTMVQRSDIFGRYFGGGSGGLVLERDEVIVRANTLSGIDVLANDLGLREGDALKLIIVKQPDCGRVFVRDQKAQYLPAESCVGSQVFEYAVSGRSYAENGEVVVAVRLADPTRDDIPANTQSDVLAPAPMAPGAAENVVVETPSLLSAQTGTASAGNGAAIPALTVPRPQAAVVSGLPDADPDSGSGIGNGAGSVVAGIGLGDPGLAPTMTAPAETLGATPRNAAVPEILQPVAEFEGNGMDDESGATIGLARVDPNDMATAETGEATNLDVQRENGGLDTNVPRTGPAQIDSGGSGQTGQAGSGDPTGALASIRELGDAVNLAPVDTTPPAVLSDPNVIPGAGQQPDQGGQVAALTSPKVPCTVPPALTLEVRPAGMTAVIIDSPCNAYTVAELSYDGLRLGVAINGEGAGIVAAAGFQQASDAVLRFADGETIGFNIPFSDTERMARVAVVWDAGVDLDLNAFEFGAEPLSNDHVRRDRPRNFDEVRRRGGGYLIEYRPIYGVGDSASVYTYWRRRGGRTGVIKLKVEFASRVGWKRPETCGEGLFAAPEFTVLRSVAGKLERPRRRSLAPLDCAAIKDQSERFIADAVDDMIVLQR